MDSRVCVICNTEKSTDNFYIKYRECKPCNIKRSMKRYFDNKDKKSIQKKVYEKGRDVLLAKSKITKQKRNFDRKIYKQQIEELNKKLEDITQAIEMLKTPNS